MKLWTVAPLDKQEAVKIQDKYELPAIIAMLLQIRNITSAEEIEDFLSDEPKLADPYEIKDMDKAVDRIRRAVDGYEKICVYGDYDADGVTSTTLLYSYLETVGANVIYYIPSRETEGYGMNIRAVEYLKNEDVDLIVTVDNGIAAAKEIEYAKSLGIDTVVTDHHVPSGELPDACAVVDLHRADCPSKFKKLSGVGVAFKLIMALEGDYCDVDALLDNFSDLLAIGTIGDIVELRGENRLFVKRGLESIMNTDRAGLKSLVENAGLSGKKITSGNVSFSLVPRINAVGRLGLSQKSVSLFLTDDYEEAEKISVELCDDNTDRQNIEKQIIQKIDERIRQNPNILFDRILVIDGEDWHQGVIGIVASRVKEIYGKPVIIISRNGKDARASGRSVEGFPLCDAVFACSDLLTHYGGHPMAVGLSMHSDNIEVFRKRINRWAADFDEMPFDKLKIDCKLNPASLSVEIVNALEYLQPFGSGNPTPVFGLYKMTLKNIIPLANNKHLKLVFSRENTVVTALKFSVSTDEFPYEIGDVLDLAVNLGINEYKGSVNISVIIKDIKANDDDSEAILLSNRVYELFCNGVVTNETSGLMPSRNDFALLYRYLRDCGGYNYPVETLVHRLDNKLSFGKIRVILEAMRELGLIDITEGMSFCNISLLNVSGKVRLESAEIIKKLSEVSG